MDALIERYAALVDKHRALMLKAERQLWGMPEVGYREWKSSAYAQAEFEKLGFTVTTAGDIPGFICDLDTGRPGPKVAVIGELDSLFCETHPEADAETKAVHACGHHAQIATVLGCAAAFSEDGALDGLSGSIRFIAVPAEETIDMDFRGGLIRQGIIKYAAGKIEFLHRGLFDGVDMMILVHTQIIPGKQFMLHKGSDGCIIKHFEYRGVASHAGINPQDGVNALYAATIGLQACNALRETFREEDYVRFHPIMTQAGVAANAIPDVARLDAFVRASTVPKMLETNARINRALTASAAALGANLVIRDAPGNLPLHNCGELQAEFIEVAGALFGSDSLTHVGWRADSGDMGDISTLMPVIHPHTAGAGGHAHGSDYQITDPVKAVLNPAKAICATIARVLRDDAKKARRIVKNYTPVFPDKAAYFAAVDAINMDRETVLYNQDGTITLDFK